MKLEYILASEIKALGISSVIVAEIHDVAIRKEDPELEKLKEKAVRQIVAMDEESIKNQPILKSYRELVQKIGRSAKKFPPAAESLLGLVRYRGSFPLINTAVDSYNMVASKTFLAFGVHDIDKLSGPISFRLSVGEEPFTAIGSDSIKKTAACDYVYADQKQILAWLDSKDSELVKLSEETRNIVMILQGTPDTTGAYRKTAATEACELITRFCGGKYEIVEVT